MSALTRNEIKFALDEHFGALYDGKISDDFKLNFLHGVGLRLGLKLLTELGKRIGLSIFK